MTSSPHILRQFAAALALVMITSVALPAIALACETMRNACPMAAQEQPATPPCHDDPADEAPTGDHAAICCAPSASAVFDEATIVERDDVPALTLLASHEAFTASPAGAHLVRTAAQAADSPPRTASGVGLQVLYRALLN